MGDDIKIEELKIKEIELPCPWCGKKGLNLDQEIDTDITHSIFLTCYYCGDSVKILLNDLDEL